MTSLISTAPIEWIQSFRTPILDRFFQFCNFFDTAIFAILLILTVGIIINRKLALRLALILSLSAIINKYLKYTFGMPRPHHLDPLLGILTASTPGFPSGAAQNSLLLCGILIKEWAHPIKWILGPLYVGVICLSRMYLGLHFPIDILGGLVSGIILLIIYLRLTPKIIGILAMSSTALLALPVHGALCKNADITVEIPQEQLAYQSFTVTSIHQKFRDWNENDHRTSYKVMQTAANYFENAPFLVYAEETLRSQTPFHWEFVPFHSTTNVVARYWQQLQVAFRVIFNGILASEGEKGLQTALYENTFINMHTIAPEPSNGARTNDPFCNEAVIENQLVKKGELVQVLYDYRPVGESHFLIVPKAHRRDFRQLTEGEYVEAAKLSQFIIEKLKENQPVSNVYLMHKTQIDAGQSVPHWHLHIISTANTQDDFWSKVKFLWRMTFGSSPLRQDELTRRVSHYKEVFN